MGKNKKTLNLNLDRFNNINKLNESKGDKSLVLEYSGYNTFSNPLIMEADPEGEETNQETEVEQPEGEVAPEMDNNTDAPIEQAPMDELPVEEPQEETVEVDITDLVDAAKETKLTVDEILQKEELTLKALEATLGEIQALKQSINTDLSSVKDEIIKRNPTPVEKQEMVSYNAPYGQKVSDIFTQNEDGTVNMVMPDNTNANQQPTPEAQGYQPKVYSDSEIKQSFNGVVPQFEEEKVKWKY